MVPVQGVRASRRGIIGSVPYWVWIVVAFGGAATWGFTVVVDKRTLQFVDPFALNMIIRVPTMVLLAAVGGILTLTGIWDLGFGMTWAAFGYMTVSSVVVWLFAFNAYFLVLRRGALGVVTPILAIDPLFTAVFAVILLGGGLGHLVIIGLIVSTFGVVLLSRWMGDDAEAVPPAVSDSAPLVVPQPASSPLGAHSVSPRVTVIALALAASAGWGIGPVFMQLATRSLGGATFSMMLQSQAMGFLLLLPIVLRRRRIVVRPLARPERRLVVRLILITSVLETLFSLSLYVLIAEIGSVLTVLIIASSPVFSILGGRLLLGERYRWKLAIGAAVTLTGVIIATLQGM
jgi:drug/metabolite transporter (DMT)-like permease